MKERNKICNVKNILMLSKNNQNNNEKPIQKSKEILEVCVAGSEIPYLWPHVLQYPKFPSPHAFNDELQIFELTSRRGDVATW